MNSLIPRHAASRISTLLSGYPVVTVTGPRQSGKTTLVRDLLSTKAYVSMESPAAREFAQSSPAEFLAQYPEGAIIDEAQNAPALFSEIQGIVDDKKRMGMFVLTGSQNMSLLSKVTQSLAGRVAIVELLPLSIAELRDANQLPKGFAPLLVKGFFPAIYDRKLDAYEWLHNYVLTYAERDARQLAAIQDLSAFQRFMRLVAVRTGQLLNMQSLCNEVGVSDKTIKHWLSILETCYLIHYVRPHIENFGKRLIKMPKLYMTDVGLACALLGIQTTEQLNAHPLRGALFETLVVNEFLKARTNYGQRGQLYFWRDNVGTEIDLVLERGNDLAAIEIKSAPDVASDAFKNLFLWEKYAREHNQHGQIYRGIVYGGLEKFVRNNTDILPWSHL